MGKFGFCKTGHGAIRLRNRITEENIDTSHFVRYKSPAGKKPLSHYLVENYHLHSGVKQRILKEGLLKNECYECGQVPEWNGLKLTLQLDHINGNHYDNRIENLRILCPNCHSQTKNFSGKANKRNEVKVKNGKKLKFIVSKEDLQYLVNNYNLSEVAKNLR